MSSREATGRKVNQVQDAHVATDFASSDAFIALCLLFTLLFSFKFSLVLMIITVHVFGVGVVGGRSGRNLIFR